MSSYNNITVQSTKHCSLIIWLLYSPVLTFSVPEVASAEFKFLHFRHAESQNLRLQTWYGMRIVITWCYGQKTTWWCLHVECGILHACITAIQQFGLLLRALCRRTKSWHQRQARPARLALFTNFLYNMEREPRWPHQIKKALHIGNERLCPDCNPGLLFWSWVDPSP